MLALPSSGLKVMGDADDNITLKYVCETFQKYVSIVAAQSHVRNVLGIDATQEVLLY